LVRPSIPFISYSLAYFWSFCFKGVSRFLSHCCRRLLKFHEERKLTSFKKKKSNAVPVIPAEELGKELLEVCFQEWLKNKCSSRGRDEGLLENKGHSRGQDEEPEIINLISDDES
jgi:hypothetical protein